MRLRELIVIAALLSGVNSFGAQGSAAGTAPATSASAVRAAASAVMADPLLGVTETTQRLRFKTSGDKPRKPEPGDPLRWWKDLLANLSGGLRVAIWLIGAGIFIAVLLRLRDWLMARESGAEPLVEMPSHVGTLDIRPESLPRDVGAAARELALKGELRAAMSLLYRGALSRLVHAHGAPIRSASTENDCLRLASARLTADAQAYLQALVGCWQAVAYTQRQVLPEDLEPLCANFDLKLPDLAARRPA